MQKWLYLFAALIVLSSPLIVRADDATAVKELLDKALRAHGGSAKAAALNEVTLKGKAQASEGGQTEQFEFELSFKDLDKARLEITHMGNGSVDKATMVIAGDKVWGRDQNRGKTDEAPEPVKAAIQSFMLAIIAPANPTSFEKRKDLTLAHGGEAKVGDQTAAVLRISRKDSPDLMIYFDQNTGLPLKSETQIKEPNGEERTFAFEFSDFKEEGGVKHYGKIKLLRDGKNLAEIEVTDFKAGEKIEASTFEKL